MKPTILFARSSALHLFREGYQWLEQFCQRKTNCGRKSFTFNFLIWLSNGDLPKPSGNSMQRRFSSCRISYTYKDGEVTSLIFLNLRGLPRNIPLQYHDFIPNLKLGCFPGIIQAMVAVSAPPQPDEKAGAAERLSAGCDLIKG